MGNSLVHINFLLGCLYLKEEKISASAKKQKFVVSPNTKKVVSAAAQKYQTGLKVHEPNPFKIDKIISIRV